MWIWKLAVIMFIFSLEAVACVTPVYRYSLEEWFCDNYRVTVFYSPGSLTAHTERLEPMVEATSISYGDWPTELKIKPEKESVKANLSMRFINIDDEMSVADAEMWKAQRDSEVPWVVIRYPSSSRMKHSVWSGPLSYFRIGESLIDSPARQKINKSLIDGETAMWVLIESDDKKANKKATETILKGIQTSVKTLKLPAAVYAKDENTLSGTTASEWKVSFDTLSLSHNDKKEIPFITMMLKSQPSLLKKLKEPIAFVFYGRCRILKGIPASELTEKSVVEANSFLLDSCQCEVKEQNPGSDMLIKYDWSDFNTKIAKMKSVRIPLIGISDFIPEMETENSGDKKSLDDKDNEKIQKKLTSSCCSAQ